ncbi:MAG: cytochrome P450 [Roseibium sp.]|nr:cytochrome P450 [Roseibium sp.]
MSSEIPPSSAPVPAFVPPAPNILGFPQNLVQLVRNNLGIIPRQAYEQPLVVTDSFPKMAFVTGPDLVEHVLKRSADRFPKGKLQNETLEPLFGNAMISSEGADWKWQRSITAPLFRHDEILQYIPAMRDAATRQLETWKAQDLAANRPVNKDMFRIAFDVISRTMLVGGADDVIKAIEQGHAAYFHHVNWWIAYKMLGLPGWLPRPGGAVMRTQEKRIRDAVSKLVRGRLASAETEQDLLGRLVRGIDPETGEAMSEERLVNNIIAFLVAGYDTTALALAWALYLLALYPDWQQQIRNEIQAVAGDRPIGREHLSQLNVTDQVLNEALRLYPTAPIIVRDILEDVELAGTKVPKGTIGVIPIYAIHRHRSFWDSPNVFDPLRFAPEAETKPGRYQFLPFGAGPRICIGAAFTMIEAKVVLATLLREVSFELEHGHEAHPVGQMFLTPREPIPMRVRFLDR